MKKKEQGIFYLLLLYFASKAVYFALNIKQHVFPDEASWFGMIKVFSRSYLLPVDSPETYPLGLVTHIPSLYFFLMGKILTLNIFGLNDLILMRLVNVGFGIFMVYFCWRLVCLLLPNAGGRLLTLVMLTNTMMFTFMAGAVNHDNLSALLAVLALYCLILFQRQRTVKVFLWLLIFLLAGMLTKNVFLPYAMGIALVLLFSDWQKIFFLRISFWDNCQSLSGYDYLKIPVVLILLTANFNLYLGNKIHYDRLIPTMDQVLVVEDCLQNRLFARGYAVHQFKEGKLSMLESQRLALQIRDPGDRAFAMQLLRSASQEKSKAETIRQGRIPYAVEWFGFMTARLYGVAAHLSLYKADRWLWGYYAIFMLASVLLVYRFFKDSCASFGGLLFVVSFFVVILMQFVNYGGYSDTGFVGLAVSGRYLFPIIVPIYILIAHGLMSKMPMWWQRLAGLSVSIFFVYSEFPWFVQNATSSWYF